MESITIRSLYAYPFPMRLAELSRATGVPTATIKWYLRDGLLPKGAATARNQAQYDESHVRRLRLIRALVEVGGLSTQATRDILAVVDDEAAPLDAVVGTAHGALARTPDAPIDARALALADAYLTRRKWTVMPSSPARLELAGIIQSMVMFAPEAGIDDAALLAGLDPYADAVEHLASSEVSDLPDDVSRDNLVEQVVLGTVLSERVLGSLRRLAQESAFLTAYAGSATPKS